MNPNTEKIEFQSTLLQEERLDNGRILYADYVISIHAPTRGATEMFDYLCQFHLISIHAPTRGATKMNYIICVKVRISIHAPTRGATLEYHLYHIRKKFQSTLLQEERQYCREC